MTFEEAKTATRPYITARNAAAYNGQVDQMLWIEENIMDPAGINSSICTDFGERVRLWIEEEELDKVA